ncbi:MAG: hypothetical protein GY841_08725 [FCB group bacterium]|nr:hypothetical protein [FCB group bacterium]
MVYRGECSLKINERVKMKTGWLRKDELIYTGMPNDHTYSLAMTWSFAHNSMAYNLFIPVNQKEIRHDYVTIIVKRVTSTGIDLEFQPR